MAQRVKRLPTMRETPVRSLGREEPLEKEIATHSSILAWRIPMDRGAWWASVHGVAKSWLWLSMHAGTCKRKLTHKQTQKEPLGYSWRSWMKDVCATFPPVCKVKELSRTRRCTLTLVLVKLSGWSHVLETSESLELAWHPSSWCLGINFVH